MKRWGLRWIFCWLSVFITAACGNVSSPTPARDSNDRTPTLQNFLPPSTASPLPTLRPLQTLTPPYSATAMRLATLDPAIDVTLDLPTCYETAVQSLICLGWIQNQHDSPLTSTLISFYLLNAQGEILHAAHVQPSLATIAPNSGSPYRVIFNQAPAEVYTPFVELKFGEAPGDQPPVQFLDVKSEWDGQSYRVSGVLVAQAGTGAELVITIRNRDRQITGFRTLNLDVEDGQANFDLVVSPLDGEPGEIILNATILQ